MQRIMALYSDNLNAKLNRNSLETCDSLKLSETLIDIENDSAGTTRFRVANNISSGFPDRSDEVPVQTSFQNSYEECNGSDIGLSKEPFRNFRSSQFSVNSGDGADIPLLEDSDEIDTVPLRPIINGTEDWDHCHPLLQRPVHNVGAWRQLIAAAVMCFLFMTAEAVGGYIAGSLAVMTDGFHLFSDFVGFLVSLFAVWLARRKPTKRLSFGYYRAEVLGALLSIIIIWVMTGMFLYLAIQRIIHQDFDIDANTMMIVAGLGIVINIVMGLILHNTCNIPGFPHSHSLSHSSHHHSINVRAAIIHVLGDFIQSVGVLVAAIVIKFHPNAKIVDPLCTLGFSVIVLLTTIRILHDTTCILMEGTPSHLDYSTVMKQLSSLESVQNVHNLHLWSLTINRNALSVHLAIDDTANCDAVLTNAQHVIREKFNVDTVTIQIERYRPDIARHCIQCQGVR